MLDLHCHILPAIDDGASDLDMALEMARIAVADGIRSAIAAFQAELDQCGIALRLVEAADVHLVPGLLEGIRADRIPTIAGSRYLLLEPSHHVAPTCAGVTCEDTSGFRRDLEPFARGDS